MQFYTRRRYLALAGTAALGSLAGCGGDSTASDEDEKTTTGPAEFSDASITGPDSVTVDNSFSLTVSVKNNGGTTGTYNDTITVTEGNKEYTTEFEIGDVSPGTTGTTELDPISLEYGDEYMFELQKGDARYATTAVPETVGQGEKLSLTKNLDVTLTDFSFEDTIGYHHEETRDFNQRNVPDSLNAPSEKVLALLRFTVENTGTDEATLGKETLTPKNGGFYDSFPKSNDLQSEFVQGEPFFGRGGQLNIQASQQLEGWLLAQFDRKSARDGITIGVQEDAKETPLEKAFEVTPESGQFDFPKFEMTSVSAPDQVKKNSDFTVDFTVENVGDGVGRFFGVMQWYSESESTWFSDSLAEQRIFDKEIEAGESKSWSVTSSSAIANTYEYRIAPLSERWTITFT